MKSVVYFVKAISADIDARAVALHRLLDNADPFSVYKKNEIAPIKLTIGDSACTFNVSPDLVKIVVSGIKRRGAKPFLFDTNVIYKGERQNAVDHMNLAQTKGFEDARVGAPFIIADGLLGQDGREYEVDSPDISKIKVPSFVGMLDSLIVLSHATGHIVSGYGGAIKNVAMGMACRPTKQIEHSSLKPVVIEKNCTACGCCIKICPVSAVALKNGKAHIDQKKCIGCGECLCACKFNAVCINWGEDPHTFCRRMVEVARFVTGKFKNRFFITFAFDFTKECDCISTKDETMVAPNLGIFASTDMVAVDKAVLDMAYEHRKTDYLQKVKDIYTKMLDYAAAKGAGNTDYELIEL